MAEKIPARADLSVAELKPWLGNLALIDIKAGGREKFRLCGTNLSVRFGTDVTGKALDSLSGEFLTPLRKCISEARTNCTPAAGHFERIIERQRVKFEELALPLGEHPDAVTTILLGCYPIKIDKAQ